MTVLCLPATQWVWAKHVHSDGECVIARWRFDEGSGDITKDTSGNGNDLRLMATEWVIDEVEILGRAKSGEEIIHETLAH